MTSHKNSNSTLQITVMILLKFANDIMLPARAIVLTCSLVLLTKKEWTPARMCSVWMEEPVKALTKRHLNALVWQILLENIVRLVSKLDGEFFSTDNLY